MPVGFIENAIVDEVNKLTDLVSVKGSDSVISRASDDVFDSDPFFKEPLNFHNDESGCRLMTFQTLGHSNVRLFDVLIFIPNLIFFTYLISGLGKANRRISSCNVYVYRAFFYLILFSATLSLARSLLSILLGLIFIRSHALDELGWVILHFGLLTTELSVLVLGMTQLDSRKSVRRVILLSSIVAVFYSIIQSVVEIKYPDPTFHYKDINLFGFGGIIFIFGSRLVFINIYGILLLLPFLKPCHKYIWALPQRKGFYVYVLFLYLLYILQIISTITIIHDNVGICILNTSLYLYFTLFIPAVYYTFLRGFFKVAQPSLLFSYKAQVDDEQVQRQSEFNNTEEEPSTVSSSNHPPGPIIINSRDVPADS